jgi:hypothetical protein
VAETLRAAGAAIDFSVIVNGSAVSGQ